MKQRPALFHGLIAALVLALPAGAVLLAAAALCGGCATGELPPGVYEFVTNSVQRLLVEGGEEPAEPEEPAGSDASETPAAAALQLRFGGVKGNPAEDARCRISNLRIGKDSLSFHWDAGIPSDWKRGDTGKGPMILAAAFYREGDTWVGGKFDWIDEHRNTRPLENIHSGYGGWNAGAWNAAAHRAFCVMSADGKLRSNLLEETK